MLISLQKDHKEHLSLLTTQPVEILIDFCKLAIDYLQNGTNPKLYQTAAEKLKLDVNSVQNCIYGLVNLLLISCKYKLSEQDFKDSILTIGFTAEQQAILYKFYESRSSEVGQVLGKLASNDLHYHDLDWRFEVQVSSRSLLEQVIPLVTLDLTLKNRNTEGAFDKKHVFLQTDVTNLVHLTQELEKALNESRSRHSRKIQRGLQHQ